MYRDTMHTARYLQAERLAAANPPARSRRTRQTRQVVGRLLVRAGERVLAANIEAPIGSGV